MGGREDPLQHSIQSFGYWPGNLIYDPEFPSGTGVMSAQQRDRGKLPLGKNCVWRIIHDLRSVCAHTDVFRIPYSRGITDELHGGVETELSCM